MIDRLAHDEARLAIAQGHIEMAIGAITGRYASGIAAMHMRDTRSALSAVLSAVMTAREAIEDASHANP